MKIPYYDLCVKLTLCFFLLSLGGCVSRKTYLMYGEDCRQSGYNKSKTEIEKLKQQYQITEEERVWYRKLYYEFKSKNAELQNTNSKLEHENIDLSNRLSRTNYELIQLKKKNERVK